MGRKYSRISAGPNYKLRFKINGHHFEDIEVTSVSPRGCGLRVEKKEHSWLDITYLDDIQLVHPELPLETLQGRVAWMQESPKDPKMLDAGVEFVNPPISYMELLEEHITLEARNRIYE